MSSTVSTAEIVRKKKFFILFCGILIFFLTSMAKVLVPATIFQDLLKLDMSVTRIASLGAAFLYSYAASQLVMGCFSDRYGGVRILLIGGSIFAAGTILFPLMENYYISRAFPPTKAAYTKKQYRRFPIFAPCIPRRRSWNIL